MIEIFDNIRKLYRFHKPCEALVDCIEFFSESSLDSMERYIGEAPFTVTLFPSYTPTIWLNLGASYQLKNGSSWHATRARTALISYVTNPRDFSPYDHGYYDMSHFLKSVVKFTGQKLSQYQSTFQRK